MSIYFHVLRWAAYETLRTAINRVDGFARAVRVTDWRGHWEEVESVECGCTARPPLELTLGEDAVMSAEDMGAWIFDELRLTLLRSQTVILWNP